MKTLKNLLFIFSFIIVANTIKVSANNGTVRDIEITNGGFTVETNGLNIWYKISGKGPVCILPTPGWAPSSDMYFNSLKELESLFTMVYIDTRGSGRSDKPEMEQYTAENFVSDIDAVRNDIGVNEVWIMGHSKGGALALKYALDYENKVLGIILLDASFGIDKPQDMMQKQIMRRQNEPWFQSASEYFNREPRDEEDWITGTMAVMPMYFYSIDGFKKSKDVISSSSLSYHAFKGQKYWYDCENEMPDKLKDINKPTLIVVGMNDFICGPYFARYAHCEISNSKLLLIENAGHFPWMEQPEEFFKGMKDFLPKLGYTYNLKE